MGAPVQDTTLFADLVNLILLGQDEGFIGSTMFFVLGGVVVVGLVILLMVLRNKRQDDD